MFFFLFFFIFQGYTIMEAVYEGWHNYQLYPYIGTDLGICTSVKPEVGGENVTSRKN